MSQNFPEVTGDTYAAVGILALQDRDNSVLTWFSGISAPENPIENQVWNDVVSKCVKWYHDSTWETIIDYGKSYITTTNLAANYQPLNSRLTNYSSVSHSGTGFITNQWIPISSFYINKLWNDFKNNIGLGSLAYKSKLTQSDIANGSISINKIVSDQRPTTEAVFNVGDVIPSFNQGNKSGCVKLSKTANTVFTVGASASNSTYKGETYKNLFKFIWTDKFIKIYNSNGKDASKGNTWTADWNNNKQLELPHIDLPEADVPAEFNVNKTAGTIGYSGNYTVKKSGYYYMTLVGGGGGAAASSAGTWGHQSSCSGASGSAFKGEILLNKNDVINYNIGAGGNGGNPRGDWGHPPSEGSAGGNSVLKLNGSNLVTCSGGGGAIAGWGRHSWTEPTGGITTIHQPNRFTANTTQSINGEDGHGIGNALVVSVNGPLGNDYGKGGSAQSFGDNSKPKRESGIAGYFNLKFLAPKEYGTSDSTVKTSLDNMYKAITYFMKY